MLREIFKRNTDNTHVYVFSKTVLPYPENGQAYVLFKYVESTTPTKEYRTNFMSMELSEFIRTFTKVKKLSL